MKILIVAATTAEILPFIRHFLPAAEITTSHIILNSETDVLVTGVGMVATTYLLSRHLQHHRYDLVINAGIGGAFNRDIALGSVLEIVDEQLPELGAEDGDQFLSIFQLNLLGENAAPFNNSRISNPYSHQLKALTDVRKASAHTVNTVHGKEESIAALVSRLPADAESMEGAAFAYVCHMENIQYMQLRAISNYVERRNRAAWQIGPAVKNLNSTLIAVLNELRGNE